MLQAVPTSSIISFIKRTALLGLAWLVMTGGAAGALVYGLVAVLAAAALSLVLLPPGPRPAVLIRLAALAPDFLVRSILGGVDVAWRALHPHLPVRPGWINLPTRMTDGPARALFGAETSLLPGTLSAGCDGDGLKIHCLDLDARTRARLEAEEARLARAFSQHDGPEP
ncbi:hypothetical protein F1654_12190 [Alkalicaulis satelles]|uniref:Sodium:proton antiporter n=1 Tax=Alkalicaulis satelles TaxID=2609175 RepID=A0A5M6ZB80_9PROT|nr:Na+/H+ antiporter subunit E [Alkalicaulis satelles]KAA5801645.1 hypothetical protein F1654_12190 [Alkalicaulis satelles]